MGRDYFYREECIQDDDCSKVSCDDRSTALVFGLVIERGEFCGLSEKSEYERSGPAHGRPFESLISLRLWIRFLYGLHRRIAKFKLP